MSLISFYSVQETPDLQWDVVKTTGHQNSGSKTTVVETHTDEKAAKVAAQKLADTTGFPFIKAEKRIDLFSFERKPGQLNLNNSGIKQNVSGLTRRHKQPVNPNLNG